LPSSDNSFDLGNSTYRWRNAYFSGTIYGSISSSGNLLPSADNSYDLGSSSLRWRDLWLSRNAYIAGNVGIGTTSPGAKLHIQGGKLYVDPNNFGGSAAISLAVGDTDTGLNSAGDGQLDIYSNNVNTMSIRSGKVGIGTTNPVKKLDVVGDINATGYVYGMSGLCIGADCKTNWSQVGGIFPWDNSTTQIFVREGFPSFVNISNALFVNGTSFSIRLQPSSITPLPLNGTIYYDASLNKFRCYQNGVWTDCITSVPEGASGFWVLSGSMLYPNQTSWNVGIGTTTPSEKLEVQGRVLVASSNPFELEPSDGILDVKGSINATVVIFVPKQSSQPFACDASKAGAIFYNTSNNKFYGCNSTNWVIIGG
jgi:hypothetical protein